MKKHTDESKKKISESKYKPVLQYDLNGHYLNRFNSIKEASEILHIGHNNISSVCNGKDKKSTGSYIWRFESKKYIVGQDRML